MSTRFLMSKATESLKPSTKLSTITLRDWRNALNTACEGVTSSTAKSLRGALVSFSHYCESRRWDAEKLSATVLPISDRLLKDTVPRQALTEDELRRLAELDEYDSYMAYAFRLLPLTGLFEKIAMSIVKEEPIEDEDAIALAALNELDERLLPTPTIALDQVEACVSQMIELARHNFDACVKQIYEFDPDRDARIKQREDLLDKITDATNNYIIGMSPYVKSDKDTKRQNYNLKAIICFERIGDLAVNITEALAELRKSGKTFSPNAMAELRILIDASYEILDITSEAYINKDTSLAVKVEPLEEVIDDLVEDMNARHVYRMVNNLCDAVLGIYFQNILTNLEHISDKCSDVAVYILEGDNQEIVGNEHAYLHELHHSENREYMAMYDENSRRYFDKLNVIPITDKID